MISTEINRLYREAKRVGMTPKHFKINQKSFTTLENEISEFLVLKIKKNRKPEINGVPIIIDEMVPDGAVFMTFK